MDRSMSFNGVKVFSASTIADREGLGERITKWLRERDVEVVDEVTSQSSDEAYHCVTVTLFYREALPHPPGV